MQNSVHAILWLLSHDCVLLGLIYTDPQKTPAAENGIHPICDVTPTSGNIKFVHI